MATKNGANYLNEQLESLNSQKEGFDLYINDDSSSDDTIKIIKEFQFKSSVNLFLGEIKHNSYPQNFFKTLINIKERYDYYFFCDQDDIWHNDKISKYIEILKKTPDKPTLVCSRTTIIDSDGFEIDKSPNFKNCSSFAHSLVQNIAGGNTMGFNYESVLICKKVKDFDQIVSHDWTLYQLVQSFNGYTHYLETPYTKYRRHEGNIIGPNNGFFAKLKRLFMLFDGEFKKWTDMNLDLLKSISDIPENRKQDIINFEKIRNLGILERTYLFIKQNFKRHSLISNLTLLVAVIIKKI